MFPTTLIAILALASRRAALGRLAVFRQRLIDAEYVVEERVENYEQPEQPEQDQEVSPEVLKSVIEELRLRDGTGVEGPAGSDTRADVEGDHSDDAGKRSPSDRGEEIQWNMEGDWEEEDSDGAWESVEG